MGAWIFLAGSLVTGIVGLSRSMSTDRPAGAGGIDCLCLFAVLLAVVAAVLALLGIHQQNVVLYDSIGTGYQGSHGSDDDSGGDE
jgi:hypothetical protein